MPKAVTHRRWPNPLPIPVSAFVPAKDTYDWHFDAVLGGVPSELRNRTSLTLQRFFAPVQLPQGAVVTSLRLFGFKNTAPGEVTATLYRGDRAAGSVNMATFSAPNWGGYGNGADSSVTSPEIDNINYDYYIEVKLDPDANIEDNRFSGCLIHWS